MYDIDVEGVHKFTESSALTPGNKLTTFTVDGVKCGLGICYDIYLEEFAKCYRKAGCQVMFYPAAFNPIIGPLHWDLVARARSCDNQVYLATISPARDSTAEYVAWGHSTVCDPWGRITLQAGENEEILYTEFGMEIWLILFSYHF